MPTDTEPPTFERGWLQEQVERCVRSLDGLPAGLRRTLSCPTSPARLRHPDLGPVVSGAVHHPTEET